MSKGPELDQFTNGRAFWAAAPSSLDLAIFDATPSLCVPQSGALDEIAVDHRRYLLARDGVYLEVRSRAMHVCVRIAEVTMPYGPVEERVDLAGGPIPLGVLNSAVAIAQEANPNEVAMVVSHDPSARGGYTLRKMPFQEASPAHVTYADDVDDNYLTLDLHSHGEGSAFFSWTDDQSDTSRLGPYFALVIGRCGALDNIQIAARFCCSPALLPMSLETLIAWRVFQ